MAKAKNPSLAQLEALALLNDDEKIRKIRDLERKLASATQAKKEAEAKYKQSEKDLLLAEDNTELILATQDEKTLRKLEMSKKRRGKGKASAIICVNDWHCEENVDPEVTGNANKFNPKIADRRIENTWQKAVYLLDTIKSFTNIQEVVIWAGGDMINGYIHEELMESNFTGPAPAILYMQEKLITGIEFIKSQVKCDQITFLGNYGNHGRTTRKKPISTGWKTSWEWLAYNNVALHFQNDPNVNFKIAKGYHLWMPIQGHDVRFHHGDAIKGGGGIGGVHIPLRKKIAQWNKERQAELDVLGHFHQYAEDWNYVLCGCLVGYNAYAQYIGAEAQPPTQTLIVIDYEHGKILSMPIFCDDTLVR